MRVKLDLSYRSSGSSSGTVVISQTNRQTSQGIAVKNNDEILNVSKEEVDKKNASTSEDDDDFLEVENPAAVIRKCRKAFEDFIIANSSRASGKMGKRKFSFAGEEKRPLPRAKIESNDNRLSVSSQDSENHFDSSKDSVSMDSTTVEFEVLDAVERVLQVDVSSKMSPNSGSQVNEPPVSLLRPNGEVIDWDVFLENRFNVSCVAPVEFFPNAPLANIWKSIAVVGLVIEMRNPFLGPKAGTEIYWLGHIKHFSGYKALIEFEAMNTDHDREQHIAWISFCSHIPKRLGWCAENHKELNAGKVVVGKLETNVFLAEFVKFYVNPTPTIASNHLDEIKKNIESMVPFKLNEVVEAIDMSHPYRCRLGKVLSIIGDRIFVEYIGADNDNENGLWCSLKSDLVHPIGWSFSVGVSLVGTDAEEFDGVKAASVLPQDNFPEYPFTIVIERGMRLETRHPLFPNRIVGAIVKKVLNHGYFVIETRESRSETRVKNIVHVTSPFIYPVDWSKIWGINEETEFCPKRIPFIHEPINLSDLPKRKAHQFGVGLKLEAIQHHNPTYSVPATIVRTADHMLCIHYDNLDKQFEMNYVWEDAEVSSIYPVGYAEMVGLNFKGQVL